MTGTTSCSVCGELPAHVTADLEEGEKLPASVGTLESIAGGRVRRCPSCRAWFLYEYDYEYGAIGDGWETAAIERVDGDRVREVLLASSPSDEIGAALRELGVADGERAIEDALVADLSDDKASYEAARKLVHVYLGRSDTAAVERLLRHPRAKVRADTLYLLQTYRGALWFKAMRAATDPSPEVRAAAVQRAAAPTSELALGPAIVECLEDPDPKVRSNAAWALAVYAERGDDITDALPSLAAVLLTDRDGGARTTAARALTSAAQKGADGSGVLGVVELLPESDPLRAQVLDAIRTELARTRRVYVCRCPKCGSTDAGRDESRSMYEFTFMQCNGCGDGGLVDSWERDEDWLVAYDLPVHNPELPSHLPPLGPGEYFAEQIRAARDRAEASAKASEPATAAEPRPLPSLDDVPLDRPPPVVATPREPIYRGMPTSWLLEPDEVDALWALGISLEAASVPDAQLQRALEEHRVEQAFSTSSMGTAETYWTDAGAGTPLPEVRSDGIVLPPGRRAAQTSRDAWLDDRDVYRALWRPFFEDQARTIAQRVPVARHPALVDAYALLLVELEEQWADGPTLDVRAPLLELLRADGPVVRDEVERLLAQHRDRGVRHLVQGLRARWLTHDVKAAFGAVLDSVERIHDQHTRWTTRMELLRCALRATRSDETSA